MFCLALFAVLAVADAAVCQIKTDQNGNCLLPCLCCHAAGVVHVSPMIHTEQVTSYRPMPTIIETVLLPVHIFHPPRV
jgi:hypothetical protein